MPRVPERCCERKAAARRGASEGAPKQSIGDGAIRLTLTVLATFISLTIPSAAGANSSGTAVGQGAVSSSAVRHGELERAVSEQCPDHRAGLRFYISRFADHRTKMGAGSGRPHGLAETRNPSAARTPLPCRRVLPAAKLWRFRAYRARIALERFQERRYVLRDFEVAPGNRAWLRAVREAQGPFPGTSSWLRSCSASEGGWGRWVPNSQGSGVGGWLQMFPSTFWRMFTAAKADAERRGFRVPSSAASWYSPIGQALGGAWAIQNGRRHEWVGHGC